MKLYTFRLLAALLGLLLLVPLGCTGPRQEGDERTPRRRTRPPAQYVDLALEPQSNVARTVQLYAGTREVRLPITSLRGGEGLTLEFDLLAETGRPLSVYFYHADRQWRRDLAPIEFMTAFQRDDLLNYELSVGTDVPYVHYSYSFPNETIGFRISGNYVLRVTEQGREDEVLFERPFFVTEQSVPMELSIDNILLGGQAFAVNQPIALFRPPADLQGDVFGYDVCFMQNGRLEQARCSDQPSLAEQPSLLFYLEPENAFEPSNADYFLDLGNLRVSSRIVKTDFSTSPYTIVLDADYARFPGGADFAPLLSGQPVVTEAVVDVAEPDVAAEYVSVHFSYVPPNEQPLSDDLIVTGSFNNWRYDAANRLVWVEEAGRYEGEVLIKQGQYEYRYVSPDPAVRRALLGTLPRQENLYNAFVYYRDIALNTDRLLAAQGIVTQ